MYTFVAVIAEIRVHVLSMTTQKIKNKGDNNMLNNFDHSLELVGKSTIVTVHKLKGNLPILNVDNVTINGYASNLDSEKPYNISNGITTIYLKNVFENSKHSAKIPFSTEEEAKKGFIVLQKAFKEYTTGK